MHAGQQPQFGARQADRTYHERQGAYAIVIVGGRLLVVETAGGLFLPGGGAGAGESAEDALRRELREETGFPVAVLRELGRAGQYVVEQETGSGFNKLETFFLVELGPRQSEPAEPDHTLRWLDGEEAAAALCEEAQAWAVRRVAAARRLLRQSEFRLLGGARRRWLPAEGERWGSCQDGECRAGSRSLALAAEQLRGGGRALGAPVALGVAAGGRHLPGRCRLRHAPRGAA